MKMFFTYVWVVLRHKWFVFVAGRVCGVSLYRLLIHDLSKFSPAEFGPYARRFCSGNAGKLNKSGDPEDFHYAWLHHQHCNPHHWEYWCQVDVGDFNELDRPDGYANALKMPEKFAREMVADWWAAGRAYEGRWCLPEWYEKNRYKMVLHPETRELVERLIVKSFLKLRTPEPEGAGVMLGDG